MNYQHSTQATHSHTRPVRTQPTSMPSDHERTHTQNHTDEFVETFLGPVLRFTLLLVLLITGFMSQMKSAKAAVVKDINTKLTTVLGHAPTITNIFRANEENLSKAATPDAPWAGDYWPDINGGISRHYRSQSELELKVVHAMKYRVAKHAFLDDHEKVKDHITDHPREMEWDNEKMNRRMSPSEKYDLLLGDLKFSFTKAIMQEIDFRANHRLTRKHGKFDDEELNTGRGEGGDYEDEDESYSEYDDDVLYGYWNPHHARIPYWSGICDGWAQASIHLPRPVKPVTVRGMLGHHIKFYPDDIKALGSYLFAKTNQGDSRTMQYKFVGRRCESKDAPNGERGIISDLRCNDVDAGVWHLTLTNRIGKDKMGIVFERDNKTSVNNHPIGSYEFSYFNPATGAFGKLSDSIVHRSQLADPYRDRRNAKTTYIVGVQSAIIYVKTPWAESNRDEEHDDASKDLKRELHKKELYVYDLELDADGNIVGGEWGDRSRDTANHTYEYTQPDFIWMASPQNLAYSDMSRFAHPGDTIDFSKATPFGNTRWAWDGKRPLPQDWLDMAKIDEILQLPIEGRKDSKGDVFPIEARGSMLKAPQPLSHIVYYLFDQAKRSTP